MKFTLKLTAFSIGSWGLISGMFFPDVMLELFLGMICPLVIGVITILLVERVYKTNTEKLTQLMSAAFFAKLILYGVYVSVVIGFFHFDRTPFIFSFVGYFSVLHILEAMYFRTLFNQK